MEWGNENENPENRAGCGSILGASVFVASIFAANILAARARHLTGALPLPEVDDHVERLTKLFDRGGSCLAVRTRAAKPITRKH
jgi:hypothetical protein